MPLHERSERRPDGCLQHHVDAAWHLGVCVVVGLVVLLACWVHG